ncbi:hypothetical protein QQ045_017537 [Rhodiola kirilowii]
MKDYIDEEEERVRLIKVVEYLEPTMAKKLLCKFPDNSVFDFDYSQSSIWSPMAPRAFKSLPHLEMERVLDFDSIKEQKKDDDDDVISPHSVKQRKQRLCGYKFGSVNKSALKTVSTSIKSKAMNLIFDGSKMTKYANLVPSVKQRSTTSKSSKGWDGVLKAASNHFKKRRKKKDQIVHVKLSEYNMKKNGI